MLGAGGEDAGGGAAAGGLSRGADAPRPTLEPLEAPADAEPSSLSGLGLPLGVAAALLLLATLLLRRRRADAAGQETPAEPLPSLRALLEAGASAEALAATLSTRLRTSVDGAKLASLLDEYDAVFLGVGAGAPGFMAGRPP